MPDFITYLGFQFVLFDEYDETFQVTSRINFLMSITGAPVRLGTCGLTSPQQV